MYLSIDYVEGIGPEYLKKLEHAGVRTVSDFLAVTKTQEQREELSHRCGIQIGYINKWASTVDLSRVDGVGFQYAELLTHSGVNSVSDLRKRNPDNLYDIISAKNNTGKHLVNHIPSPALLEKFIMNSKSLANILIP